MKLSPSLLIRKTALSTLLFAGFIAQNASAGFVWDLRATKINNNPLSGSDTTKTVGVQAGDVITLDMFAMITGSTAALEGFQSGLGKTITTSAGVTGNQGGAALDALFVNPSAALPTLQDLNGDGFLDYGVTAATTTSTTGGWFPRTSLSPGFQTNGVAITNGQEFHLFSFTYTVLAAPVATTASIQFTQQTTTIINSAAFSVDGSALIASKGIGQPVGPNATILGAPVVLTGIVNVPEPSAFGMLALGALGLVGFRRMGLRRTA